MEMVKDLTILTYLVLCLQVRSLNLIFTFYLNLQEKTKNENKLRYQNKSAEQLFFFNYCIRLIGCEFQALCRNLLYVSWTPRGIVKSLGGTNIVESTFHYASQTFLCFLRLSTITNLTCLHRAGESIHLSNIRQTFQLAIFQLAIFRLAIFQLCWLGFEVFNLLQTSIASVS